MFSINETFDFNETYNFSFPGRYSLPFDHLHIRVIFIIGYVIVFSLCIFGNLMVLFAIVRSARLRSMTNFFLANLAVADFCVGIFCVLPNLSMFLSPQWKLGRVMCKVYYFVWNMCYTASIVILTAIATERYIAIKYPLKARRCFTLKRLIIAQIVIWTVAGVYNIPYLVVFDIHATNSMQGTAYYCFYNFGIIDMRALTTANFVMWYSVPLAVMTFMYSRIGTLLWRVGSGQPILRRRPTEQPEDTHYTSSSGGSDCHYTIKLHDYSSKKRLSGDTDINNCHGGYTYRNGQTSINGIIVKGKLCNKRDTNGSCFCSDKVEGENSSDSPNNEITERLSSRPNIDIKLEFTCCRHPSFEKSCYRDSGDRYHLTNNRESADGDKIFSSVRYRNNINSNPTRINSTRALQNRRKVIRLLVAVVVSFALCVLPHHIRLLLKYWEVSSSKVTLISPVSFLILFLNSALNPILYALFSANFRKSFKEVIPCKRRFSSTSILLQDTKFGSF